MLAQFEKAKTWPDKKALAIRLGVRVATLYSWRKKLAMHGTLENLPHGAAKAAAPNGAPRAIAAMQEPPRRRGRPRMDQGQELRDLREKNRLLRDMVAMAVKQGFLAKLFE